VKRLRIGSRGSVLAQWQANFVRERLAQLAGVEAEIILIKTSGDRFQQANVNQIGLKGVFIKELEDALLDARVDLAVHSMKDVPTEIPSGLTFPAICKREDVRDALVGHEKGASLAGLPQGARVGTSSLRRQSQLRHLRPDLKLLELRGNVDTRLKKVESGDYDAIVLAKAGLDRLGWSAKISEVIPTEISLPAVGQGALGIEARAEDRSVLDLLARLDDAETRAAITAERALLAKLEGGCQVPLGAWGRMEDGQMHLDAAVLSPDGAECIRMHAVGSADKAESLGRDLAHNLLAAGADKILRLVGRDVGKS
jgi:hydroxymethylbilane synthase